MRPELTEAAANHKVKLLYIAGNGRSGSTLLQTILGQLDGFFAVGELRRIWDRSLIENRICGCGVPFSSCPVWEQVFEEAYGGFDGVGAEAMVRYREAMTQTKHLPGMLLNRGGRPFRGGSAMEDFLQHLDRLYRAIATVSGCKVIVDASKWPMYARLVECLPAVEIYVLHLVRDPRAVAFSWSRTKEYEKGRLLLRQGAARSTLYWLTWNPAIAYLWNRPEARYAFLRYESFVADPRGSIGRILELLGEEEQSLAFLQGKQVQLEETHSVAGNIARTTTGAIDLRLDDEWERHLPASKRRLVSAMTWPLLSHYGYRRIASKR